MNKSIFTLFLAVLTCPAVAGMGGVVVKGVARSWDEIARVALKASGKTASDDAVKAASKTIERAASAHGDDVAKASMRGGVEVAEQSLKKGEVFVSLIKSAERYSDDVVRAIALNSDDAVKYAARYGDDVVKEMAAKIPADQIPQVFGAMEKNPQVAKQFLDCVARGGKDFVDKIFAVNARQIMAGGLSAALITAAYRATAPMSAEGAVIEEQNKNAMDIVKKASPEEQSKFVKEVVGQNGEVRKSWTAIVFWSSIILSSFAGLALIIFVMRKTKVGRRKRRENDANSGAVDSREGEWTVSR